MFLFSAVLPKRQILSIPMIEIARALFKSRSPVEGTRNCCSVREVGFTALVFMRIWYDVSGAELFFQS